MDRRKVIRKLTEMKLSQNHNILAVGGYSMAPLLIPGDTAEIRPEPRYKVGDVVVVIDDKARLLVHRIIRCTPDGYQTKGDNAVACEQIEKAFCLGRVSRVENRNGKNQILNRRFLRDRCVVMLSRRVHRMWKETGNCRIAVSSWPHRTIYRLAPPEIRRCAQGVEYYLVCVARRVIADQCGAPRFTAGYEIDPEKVSFTREHVKLILQHQLLSLFYPYVLSVSGRYGKMLKLHRALHLDQMRRLLQACIDVCALFDRHQIPYAVIKGLSVSVCAYGDPMARESSDIDYLILERDAQRAHQLLYEAGFVNYDEERKHFTVPAPQEHYPTHYIPYKIPDADICVELHSAQHIEPAYTEALLGRGTVISVQGHAISVLNETDSFMCLLNCVAADDFGCAKMTFEDDPTMFLRLKMRNYIDIICFYLKNRERICEDEILKRSVEYRCAFYQFFSLACAAAFFETDIFDSLIVRLNFAEHVNRMRLPVSVYECMFNPLRMKMNSDYLYCLQKRFFAENLRRRFFSDNTFDYINAIPAAAGGKPVILESDDGYTEITLPGKRISWISVLERSRLPEDHFAIACSLINPDFTQERLYCKVIFLCENGIWRRAVFHETELRTWDALILGNENRRRFRKIKIEQSPGQLFLKYACPRRVIGLSPAYPATALELDLFCVASDAVRFIRSLNDKTVKMFKITVW